MTRKHTFVLAVAAMLAATPALAQKTGPNGGLVGGSGSHQTELVVAPSALTVYLLENGKPHESKGTKMRAVIQQGGKNTTVALKDDGTKLVGALAAPLEKGAIVVITGKDHHGDLFNARYVLN